MVALNPVLFRAVDPDGGVHHFTRRPENVCTEVAWATADGRATIHHGDCLDVMRTMADGSVDAVVTDPPYGLGFMDKGWDKPTAESWGYFAGSGKRPSISESQAFQATAFKWAEAMLRVAKPGAHLLAFGGTRTYHRLACAIEDAGWEIRDCLSWLYGSGFPKSHNGAWGGTALKPAWEPVILARKPLVGTVAANHAAHGTGALNIDGCRIGMDGATRKAGLQKFGWNGSGTGASVDVERIDGLGRWPANVALDEDAAAALDEQSGEREVSGSARNGRGSGAAPESIFGGPRTQGALHNDFGGASRFFYTAKASRSERETGLTGPESVNVDLTSGDRNREDERAGTNRNWPLRARNIHPTVKPVDLMRWLVRLVTPMGGTVLDPFLGSGTTLVAAIEEGCKGIGIEREAAYVEIAKARVAHAAAQGALFS